jgi:hypothetical protein
MTIIIGSFKTQFGTNRNDSITSQAGNNITFGFAGNDTLTASSNTLNALAGGVGDDTYIIQSGKSAAILDSGGNDTVRLPFGSSTSSVILYTADNRHLVAEDIATGSAITIVDWKDSSRKIENFVFSDGVTLSYDSLVSTYTSFSGYKGNFSVQSSNPNGFAYIDSGLNTSNVNSFINSVFNLGAGLASLSEVRQDPSLYMGAIKDYDGNNLGASDSWRLIGTADVQGDGDSESIFVNASNERWASVGDVNGTVDFNKNGLGGDTRVVGIYIDPTLKNQPQNRGGPFDSQRRFQNDLKIDNLNFLAAADYNKDGFQDMYFRLGDGTAVLRALMHKDGNIQYANYQSKDDLTTFMTANNVSSSIWGSWL